MASVEMAERRSPLQARTAHLAALRGPVALVERPFRVQVNVRCVPGSAAADLVCTVVGAALPTTPCTAATGDGVQALWLGPDEWLVVGGDAGLVAQLAAAVGSEGSAVDVSAQRTVIEVSGTGARDVLAQGCAIDLDPRASPPGTCVQTVLALAGVILLVGDAAFELYVRSSFAGYLADWLLDACTEIEGAARITVA